VSKVPDTPASKNTHFANRIPPDPRFGFMQALAAWADATGPGTV
jgi:hypothetical protein